MSKTRIMGAGLAGSTTRRVNVNQIQFGNKLQGLAPQATHFFIAGNGRAGWNQYRTRTNGNQQNVVFCMNQLGGVGASRSQFKIRGLNKPDGIGNCLPGSYPYLAGYIAFLKNYFGIRLPGYTLCVVGEYESVDTDLKMCSCDAIANDNFIHLETDYQVHPGQDLSDAVVALMEEAMSDLEVHRAIAYVNRQSSYITGSGCHHEYLGTHTLGLVPNDEIKELQECGYGGRIWNHLNVYSSAPNNCTNGCGKNNSWTTECCCSCGAHNSCSCAKKCGTKTASILKDGNHHHCYCGSTTKEFRCRNNAE